MKTLICTDSSAQLPAALVERLHAIVVPTSIAVGERTFDEQELDLDEFYGWLASGRRVTTSQPSPARFAEAYASAAERGAGSVVSIHVGANLSGTVGSAELAAREAPLPVEVVDTGTASFGVGICVLAAADALAAGGSAAEAADAVGRVVPRIGNVFVAEPPAKGRIQTGSRPQVLSLVGATAESLGSATSAEQAARAMVAHIGAQAGSLRVAVGHADVSVAAAADQLAAAVEALPGVNEVMRYRVGPSVGAHTGGSSFGAFWWPARVPSAPPRRSAG